MASSRYFPALVVCMLLSLVVVHSGRVVDLYYRALEHASPHAMVWKRLFTLPSRGWRACLLRAQSTPVPLTKPSGADDAEVQTEVHIELYFPNFWILAPLVSAAVAALNISCMPLMDVDWSGEGSALKSLASLLRQLAHFSQMDLTFLSSLGAALPQPLTEYSLWAIALLIAFTTWASFSFLDRRGSDQLRRSAWRSYDLASKYMLVGNRLEARDLSALQEDLLDLWVVISNEILSLTEEATAQHTCQVRTALVQSFIPALIEVEHMEGESVVVNVTLRRSLVGLARRSKRLLEEALPSPKRRGDKPVILADWKKFVARISRPRFEELAEALTLDVEAGCWEHLSGQFGRVKERVDDFFWWICRSRSSKFSSEM